MALGVRKPVFVESTVCEVCPHCSDDRSPAGSADGCNLLFLSRIDKGKGAIETIDAYAALAGRYPGLSLTIAGDGPELPAVRRYAEERGVNGIRFLGHVTGQAKHDAFVGADVYVMPSHAEGMPVSVLEAMAHGLPVVTCAVGGIVDFFRSAVMGFLAKQPDAASVAEALEPLIRDRALRIRLGDYNRGFAAEWFMPWVAGQRLKGIYEKVLSREPGIEGSSWIENAEGRNVVTGGSLPQFASIHAKVGECGQEAT